MGTSVSRDLALKYPITGIADCCARAPTCHATTPPTSAMNYRRLTRPSHPSLGDQYIRSRAERSGDCCIAMRADRLGPLGVTFQRRRPTPRAVSVLRLHLG